LTLEQFISVVLQCRSYIRVTPNPPVGQGHRTYKGT